ncbi:hypothetical protein [Iodidimonas sp. SYSU 1G8]|uniref:hypothetical protein n=1 Tax=Iodidimonas sp. SYSU 1G8 TaxID=3133967 RepID=UPI0031FEE741
MPHAEMVLVIPVLIFTFAVMGWIVSVFRRYLKQREAIVASWARQPAANVNEAVPVPEHARAA